MTAKKVAGTYLLILLTVFLVKMIEVNGVMPLLQVLGIIVLYFSVMAALIVLFSR